MFRDPATVVISIAIPFLQLLLFGYAANLHVEHVSTVLFDEDRGVVAQRFIDALRASTSFDIHRVVFSHDAVRATIVHGDAHVGIEIPPDFSARAIRRRQAPVQVLIDGSDSTIGTAALASAAQVGLAFDRSLQAAPSTPIVDIRPRMLFNPSLRSPNFFIPGLVALIMQNITLFLTALSIVGERERSTLDQLLMAPIGAGALIIGKLLPYALIGIADICLILLGMHFVFVVPIAGSVPLLLALSFGFLMASLGMGLFISTIATSQMQAMMLAVGVLLPSIMLSGVFFERELMPPFLQAVGAVIPLTYYLEIVRGIVLRATTLADLWRQTAWMLGLGVTILILACVRFTRMET